MDKSRTDKRTFLTANCSFVTSYPNLPGDAPNDSGIFRFPASDSAAVAALLAKKNGTSTDAKSPETALDSIDLTITQKNQKIVYQLFEESIDNILKEEKPDENAVVGMVVGMQEINNTEQVHNTLSKKLGERKFFVCSNVHDEIVGTYPTLGYILPGAVGDYLPLKDEAKGKIFKNGPKIYDYSDMEPSDKPKSHSCVKTKNEKGEEVGPLNTIMAIRDLGSAQHLRSVDNYVILKNKDGTDSGRPISMVIKRTPQEIYINCHMLNASILKIFEKTENGYSEQIYDGILRKKTETDGQKTSTLLQIGDYEPLPDNSLRTSGTDMWIEYCMKRLQATINELLNDFNNVKIDKNTKVFIMGDFNDPEGKLLDKLEEDGIKIKGIHFKFKFGKGTDGDRVKSCCPNKNSAAEKGTHTSIEDVKQEEPFNKMLPKLIPKGGLRDEAIEIFGYEPMFAGDNVGEGYVDGQPEPTVTATLIDERTSDHSFVKTTHTPSADTTKTAHAGGKRRTRRRRRRSTRRNKRRMSGRRRRLTRRKR